MKKYRVYLCMLVFALLMGIKCFQPEIAETVQSSVWAQIDKDNSYSRMLGDLGSEYALLGLKRCLINAVYAVFPAVGSGDETTQMLCAEDAADATEKPS